MLIIVLLNSIQCTAGEEIEIRSAGWGKPNDDCQPSGADKGKAESECVQNFPKSTKCIFPDKFCVGAMEENLVHLTGERIAVAFVFVVLMLGSTIILVTRAMALPSASRLNMFASMVNSIIRHIE